MRFLRILALIAFASALIAADQPNEVKRVYEIKYADMNVLNKVLQTFVRGQNWTIDPQARLLIISVPAETAALIENTVQRMDVPSAAPKDLELTAWFLTATDRDSPWGTPPPPDLEKVVTQLRGTFAFKNYRVIEALVLRSRTGQRAEASGTILSESSASHNAKTTSQFSINSATITAGEKGPIVRIDGMSAGLRVPNWGPDGKVSYTVTGINGTSVDVGDGQRVVVGKSTVEGPEHMQALIVVLSVKIL